MARKVMDCRSMPSVSNCSLVIAGEEEELLRAAALHAVDVHEAKDTPEFRRELRESFVLEGSEPLPMGTATERQGVHA